jgi:ATPase family AAA domain-containing protein 3A/B
VDFEERKKLDQQRAKIKSQMAQYEDDLKRKRLQIRRATEEQIQEQRRQTERHRADLEQATISKKAMAEAEGRILVTRQTEDVKRRLILEEINADREKWIQVINTTFEHIGGMPY